ncbi:MAG: glycosyltransferase [Pseudomonadales bacterium]|nr:glycosyltransferase [Pseudomonadales bacterium]
MSSLELSVVVPIVERSEELLQLNAAYLKNIAACSEAYEVIYVLDRCADSVEKMIDTTISNNRSCKKIRLPKFFGDATALSTGLSASSGSNILILTPYGQIAPEEIPNVIAGLAEHDVVIAQRIRTGEPWFNRVQAKAFSFLANSVVVDLGIADVTCEVRALRRRVTEEIDLYGDMNRFLPQLAYRLGFNIGAVAVKPAHTDRSLKVYAPGTYMRRLLDILTALFLIRFTKKPLRFFGFVGATTFLMGALVLSWVTFERLAYGVQLGDRPGLFLGALGIVLGLQIVAVGLVGEIIIFSHAKDLPEYRVAEVIEYQKNTRQ